LEGEVKSYASLSRQEKLSVNVALSGYAEKFASLGMKLNVTDSAENKTLFKILTSLSTFITLVLAGIPRGPQLFIVGGKPVLPGWGSNPVTGILKGINSDDNSAMDLDVSKDDSKKDSNKDSNKDSSYLSRSASSFDSQAVTLTKASSQGEDTPKNKRFPLLLTIFLSFLAIFILTFFFFPGFIHYFTPDHRSSSVVLIVEEASLLEEPVAPEESYQADPSDKDITVASAEEYEEEVPSGVRSLPGPLTTIEAPPSKENTRRRPRPFRVALPDPPAEKTTPATPVTQDQKTTPTEANPPTEKTPAATLPQVPQKRYGSELIIPAEAEDLSFLEGCWESFSNLYTLDNLPVVYIYCFNKTGGADVYIEEEDKDGKLSGVCEGKASATFVGNLLQIKDSGVKCPYRNGSYVSTVIKCQIRSGGKSDCVGQSKGHPSFNTTFTYSGTKWGG
jgi:hypothetical protein